METIQKQPETETLETEQSQEQTPEQFRQSLEIFNKYREVSEEEAKEPEHTMRFDKVEQELVAGLRGTLNEFIQQATENRKSVSVADMFDQLDAAIRAQADDHSEETLDQLYLVATKMRYNLQVRFDRAQRAEADNTNSSSTFEWPKFTFAAAEPIPRSSKKSQSRYMFRTVIPSTSKAAEDDADYNDDPMPRSNTPLSTGPDLNARAQDTIKQYTDGKSFNSLDSKEQGRVRRRMAQDFHPDKGDDSNIELYKVITSQTAPKPTSTTSTPPPEPKPQSQSETGQNTQSEA